MEVSLYLSLGEREDRDRKRTKAQGTWIRVVKPGCKPKLRDACVIGDSLLPLLKQETPSIRGTREKTKSAVCWSSLVQTDAFGMYTEELEEV